MAIKKFENSKPFIDCSQRIHDSFENLEEHNLKKKRKVLMVFDDMIADMEANKNLSPFATELFFQEKENSIFHSFLYHNVTSKC